MNLETLLEELRRQKNYVAVYDELLHVLSKVLNSKLQIPVDTEDEVVPHEVVSEVREFLLSVKEEHELRIQELKGTKLK